MKKVLLVPGVFIITPLLVTLSFSLRDLGYHVEIFEYPFFPEEADITKKFLEKVSVFQPEVIIGHSLGGNIAAKQLELLHISVGTLICLGSPLKGSKIAQAVKHSPFSGAIPEVVYNMLLNEIVIPKSNVKVASIAGIDDSFGFDLLFQIHVDQNKQNDGTVSVEETRIDGVHHLVMNVGHTKFLFSKEVLEQVHYFIQNNEFMVKK